MDFTRKAGTAVGWGLQAVLYQDTSCDYIQGVSDPYSEPVTKPKKIHLKYFLFDFLI